MRTKRGAQRIEPWPVHEFSNNLIGGRVMESNLKNLTNPLQSFAAFTRVAMLSVLTIWLCTTGAAAQTPTIVTTQATQIGSLGGSYGGGWAPGQSPVGGNFAVGPNGSVIVGDGYGTGVFQITPSGVQTVLANMSNTTSAAVDKYGNAYIASIAYYGATPAIYKLPYNATTGTYTGYTTAPTTNCAGGTQDTAACVFAPGTQAVITAGIGSGGAGIAIITFDVQGNLFFATDTQPQKNPNTIYECSAQCQAETDGSGTYPPVLIYADSTPLGTVVVDPWENLFFLDGSTNTSSGDVSNLQELPLVSGSYAASPTTLESYTTKSGYNGLSGLAGDSNGTIYFTTNNDGIFALPNTSKKGPNLAGIYAVSTVGGRGLAVDPSGNLYQIPYIGGDAVSRILVNNLTLPAAPVGGTATTATATLIDNAGTCPATVALKGWEFGVTTTEFTAAPGTACAAALGTGNGTFSPALPVTGAVISETITFTPTNVGERTAQIIAKDSAVSGSGSAAFSGVGQGQLATLDPGVWTGYGSGFTAPYSVSVDAAGDLAIADEGGSVYWIPAGSPAGTTPTAIGTGFTKPAATTFDANGNLYIADFANNDIVEIPNVNGTLSAAGQSILIASTVTFGGTALSSPSGLAVGPDGTLYIADLGNGRIVSYNLTSGITALRMSGLKDPWGVAVDAANNLYVANTGGGNVLVDSLGSITTLTPAGVTAPWGVVVEPSGSVLISDKTTGDIVRVPNESGTLTDADALVVEKNPKSALGLAIDASGDLYATDNSGASVYAINRTGATVSFGTVSDGTSSSPVTVDLENAGNQTVTLGTPVVTEPANTMFTLMPASTNGCQSGTAGTAGLACQLTAEFAPTVGATGPESGTATVSFVGGSSATVSLSGTATTSSLKQQTITFAPPTTVYVGQQIMLAATGGASGNAVTFSIDIASTCASCATINGTTMTVNSVGAFLVDANQPGNTNYAPATQVQVAVTAKALTAPGGAASGIVTSQLTWLGAYPAGGDENQATSAGDSFAINSAGNILISTTYGGTVILVNGQTGAVTTLGSYGQYTNTGGVAVDSKDNLYAGGLYGAGSNIIAKIPYVNGVYATLTDATQGTPPPNCTGNDTTECVLGPLAAIPGGFGTASMKFDASGNFFLATSDQGNPHSLWECTVACLAGGAGAPKPVMLFQEPTGASPSTTGQLYLGGIAIDASGNLFFTDSNEINPSANGDDSSYSDLYELSPSSGAGYGGVTTGYAAAPTLLQTFTNASPGNYDDELDGVAVDPSGNVYYTIQYEGIFAFPNVAGTINTAGGYAVSTQGGKGLSYDTLGNIYVTSYSKAVNTSGAETVARISLNNVIAPVSPLDVTATITNVTAMDNFVGCSSPATIDIASSNAEFSATAGATCSSNTNSDGTGTALYPFAGSNFPVTVNFTPSDPGPQTGTLTLTDTTNGGVSTSAVSGTGQETAQTLSITAPTVTTYTYGVAPITLAASGGASGNPIVFSVDASSTGMATISGSLLTVTGAGNLVIDANQAGGLVGSVYYAAATQVQLTLTINPAGQTISFTTLASPVSFTNGLTIALSATGGGSGNPVVFTLDAASTGAGTISGNTLTVTGVGNLVIDANQPGTTNYAAATQVQQTVQVNQGTQTITLTPPTTNIYFIVGGITIDLVGTGGGSGNAVVFTVDKSSTGAGTITGNVLMVTAQGNLVIDANQAGNANFLAAPQAQETINVRAPLPTQTITFNNPGTQVLGTPLTLSATATSGFAVMFTSSTSSVCTVSGTTTTFVTSGLCTITATQPGDNVTFAAAAPVTLSFIVNPTGELPSFTLDFSLPTLTIQSGTVGVTQLTVNSVNSFAGTVSFACSGAPSGYNCSFNPNPITVVAGQSAVTTLSISPTTAAAAVHGGSRPFLPGATLAVAVCLLGFRKRRRMQLLLLLIVSAAGLGLLSACSSNSTTTTKSTPSTVTVTATYGSQTATQTFTVIVE
jgi:sugar lactone lactonase YvrE